MLSYCHFFLLWYLIIFIPSVSLSFYFLVCIGILVDMLEQSCCRLSISCGLFFSTFLAFVSVQYYSKCNRTQWQKGENWGVFLCGKTIYLLRVKISTQCKTLSNMLILFHFQVNIFVNLPFPPFCCFYYVFPLFLLKEPQLKYFLPLSAVFYWCGRKTHSKHFSATCYSDIHSLSFRWNLSSLLNVICVHAVWVFTHACLRKVQLCCYIKVKLVWGQSQGHIIFRCLIFDTVH